MAEEYRYNKPEDWREEAKCRDHPDRLFFFPERGDLQQTRAAKAYCQDGCPVMDECLDYALINIERLGVWGGTSEMERRPLRRVRRRLQVRPG